MMSPTTPTIPVTASPTLDKPQELLLRLFGTNIDIHDEAHHERFTETIKSQSIQDKCLIEIRNLTHTVGRIVQCFKNVRRDIQLLDNRQRETNGGKHEPLSPVWDELHERFHQILQKSRDNATEAAAFMTEFADTMLTDVDEAAYPVLKEELANFLTTLRTKEVKADAARTDFRKLAEDVYVFESIFDEAVADAKVQIAQLEKEFEKTKLRIGELYTQLQEISEDIKAMATACVHSFAAGAVGVGMAIVALSPEAFLLAVSSTFEAIGVSGWRVSRLLGEKKDVKNELNKHTQLAVDQGKQLNYLNRYKESMENAGLEVKMLSTQLNTLINIWQSIKQDLNNYGTKLEMSVDPNMKITKIFLKKIARTRVLYQTLIVLLEEYARGAIIEVTDE